MPARAGRSGAADGVASGLRPRGRVMIYLLRPRVRPRISNSHDTTTRSDARSRAAPTGWFVSITLLLLHKGTRACTSHGPTRPQMWCGPDRCWQWQAAHAAWTLTVPQVDNVTVALHRTVFSVQKPYSCISLIAAAQNYTNSSTQSAPDSLTTCREVCVFAHRSILADRGSIPR